MPTQRKRSPSTTRRESQRGQRRTVGAPLVVITGLSGSGKGSVLRSLEDLGYYCVDNLPTPLIPTFVDLAVKGSEEVGRAALVVDIREPKGLRGFSARLERLRRRLPATLVFVEADDEVMMRRFSETRRPHPLGAGLREGIERERSRLEPIRAMADMVIDTSKFNPHELRRFVTRHFGGSSQRQPLMISLVSFGYRDGLPEEADLVFDVRFLPNPHFVAAYRSLTGKNRRVASYVMSFPQTRRFLERIEGLLSYLIPHYVREGKSYLTIGFGCTAGRHRSVTIARAIADRLRDRDYRVRITHRDLLKGSRKR